jgi:hypothetical protein
MTIPHALRDYRTLVAAASLVAGPLLMTIGDLLHPEERMAPVEQIAILVDDASRWYLAHLLLFAGMMVFIPGLLALAALTAARQPAVGYMARILMLVGVAAFASVFVGEMLVGRFVLDGADPAAAAALLGSMFSGPILAAVGPAMLAFFVGTVAFAVPLMRIGGTLRWAAALILVGTLFILAEILSAQVLLSQIGNVLALCGSTMAAWLILRGQAGETAVPA